MFKMASSWKISLNPLSWLMFSVIMQEHFYRPIPYVLPNIKHSTTLYTAGAVTLVGTWNNAITVVIYAQPTIHVAIGIAQSASLLKKRNGLTNWPVTFLL